MHKLVVGGGFADGNADPDATVGVAGVHLSSVGAGVAKTDAHGVMVELGAPAAVEGHSLSDGISVIADVVVVSETVIL